MKIAFTSTGTELDSQLDSSFGRCKYFVIWDSETNETTHFDNQANAAQAHGVGPKAAALVVESGAELVIAGNMPGNNAMNVLEKASIKIFVPNSTGKLTELFSQYQLQDKN